MTFVDGWAMQAIAEHLEAVTFGELNRLLINVPPGFSKSLLTNVFWPAWEWGPMDMAHLRGLSFSYAAHLTERDNEKLRTLITSKPYQELWGHQFKLTGDAKIKISNDKMGWQLASSVGGVTTGERADRVRCCKKDTLILTDKGQLKIQDIVDNKLPVKIFGYNHRTNTVQLQNILEYETNFKSEFIELGWAGGNLHCTPEHPIFVIGRGYIQAKEVKVKDRIFWSWGNDLSLPKLRAGNALQAEQKKTVLRETLPFGFYEGAEYESLRGLRESRLQNPVAMETKQSQDPLLQRQMLQDVECRGKQSWLEGPSKNKLQLVRERIWGSAIASVAPNQRVLFEFLQIKGFMGQREDASTSASGSQLPLVWETIRPHNSLSKYCSKQCKDVGKSGKNSPNYIHGGWPYPPGWNKTYVSKIRERDGNACRICGAEKDPNQALHVHHIDYNKENLDQLNLITLCKICHGRIHGFPTNKIWLEFWKKKLSPIPESILTLGSQFTICEWPRITTISQMDC